MGRSHPLSMKNLAASVILNMKHCMRGSRVRRSGISFIDENFPVGPCAVAPEELRQLQAAYRRRLQADAHLFHPLTSRESLEMSVLKLRDDLRLLRRGVKQWATAVAI